MLIAEIILAQREGYGQELFYIIAILILSIGSAIFQKIKHKFEDQEEGSSRPEAEGRIDVLDERPRQRPTAPPVRPARPAAPAAREQPRRPPVRPMPPVRERPPSRQPAAPARPAREVSRIPPKESPRRFQPQPGTTVQRPRPLQQMKPAAPARSAADQVEFIGEPLRDTMDRRDAIGQPLATERAIPLSVSLVGMSTAEMRRAVVLKEILDSPLALREVGSGSMF